MEQTKATANVLFDERHTKKDGTCPVKLTIYYDKEKKRYSTGLSITPENWNKLTSDKLRDDSIKLQKRKLNAILEKAQKIIETLEKFSFEEFEKTFFETKAQKSTLVLSSAFEAYIEILNNEGRIGNSNSYKTTLNSLLGFKPKLNLTDITPEFLKDYEKHMKIKGVSPTTTGIYLRHLRAIINRSITLGLLKSEQYPFRKYTIPSSRNIKKALDMVEIKKLLSFEPKVYNQQKAYDFWILSYLCNGMNFTDLLQLKHKNVKDDFMYYFRAKTINTKKKDLRPIKVYLPTKANALIKKWQNNGTEDDFLFPILELNMTPLQTKNKIKSFIKFVNLNMKQIAFELQIDKPIGTYAARHTHATVLKRQGASTEMIKENLGHSSVLTTENYLDSFTDDVKRDYAKLLTDF